MPESIGLKTANVNGLKTDNRKISVRLFYRTMSTDLLERIQDRLKAESLSESGAARAAGLSADAIRNLRRDLAAGKPRSMNAASIERLAPILKTTPQWLLTGEGSPEADTSLSVTAVPHISWVSAGRIEAPDVSAEIQDAPRLAIADLGPGDWIALDVVGDSMDRISPPGSQIAVNRRDTRLVPNGCYVIALEGGEATYKRFRPNPDRFEPVSTNPSHDAIFPEGPIRIVGRVRKTLLNM